MSNDEKKAFMDWIAVRERIITNSYFSNYIMHPRKMKMKNCRMRSAWNFSCQLLDSRDMHDVLLVTGDLNSNVVQDNATEIMKR